MIDLKRIAKRWILPITGSAAAMATIFYLYRGLDFGRFIGGLQDANRWWIAMLAATILLEQLVNGALLHGSDNSRKPPLPVIQAMRFV